MLDLTKLDLPMSGGTAFPVSNVSMGLSFRDLAFISLLSREPRRPAPSPHSRWQDAV